jgi:hypothetical protein
MTSVGGGVPVVVGAPTGVVVDVVGGIDVVVGGLVVVVVIGVG